MSRIMNARVAARVATALAMVSLVTACATAPQSRDDNDATAGVSGELVYRQRIAMSPDAVIRVTLADVDANTVVASDIIRPEGRQVPIAFDLAYAAADFVAGHEHRLLVTVRANNHLRWAAEVPVEDARVDGLRVRLAQAHVDADAVIGARWQLLRIVHANGDIEWARAESPSWMTFDGKNRVHGKAACNGFFGSYKLQGDGRIDFGSAGATLMACMKPNIGNTFLRALSQVERFALAGDRLYLTTADSTLVLERQE